MGSSKRRRWWIVLGSIGVTAAVAAGVAGGWGRWASHYAAAAENKAAEASPPAELSEEVEKAPVTVDRITVRPIQRVVQVVGSFWGYEEVTVMAEVPGRVVRTNHDVGDLVRPGDVLLKINPVDYELAIQETCRALELEATRIGLPIPAEKDFTREKIMAALGKFDIKQLPPVLRAQEQQENARKRLERAKQLREDKTISQEMYEFVETEYEVARNNRVQSELDARAVVAGIKHRLVLLEISQKKLRDTDVLVPTPTRHEGMPEQIEYAVAQRKVSEGEMVKDSPGTSTAVFELVLDKVLKLQGNVPERYVAQVKQGQKVEVRVDAYPDRVFAGRITRVSPVVDRLNRTFPVEILVPNPARELRPGGFAKADILTYVDPQAVTVPAAAVLVFVGSKKVLVVRDGVARAVPVTTGVEGRDARTGNWVELVRPDPKLIDRDSLLITGGHSQLADGSPVTIRRPEAAEGPAAGRPGDRQPKDKQP